MPRTSERGEEEALRVIKLALHRGHHALHTTPESRVNHGLGMGLELGPQPCPTPPTPAQTPPPTLTLACSAALLASALARAVPLRTASEAVARP